MPCSDNTIRSNSVEAKESHSKSVTWCCGAALVQQRVLSQRSLFFVSFCLFVSNFGVV